MSVKLSSYDVIKGMCVRLFLNKLFVLSLEVLIEVDALRDASDVTFLPMCYVIHPITI